MNRKEQTLEKKRETAEAELQRRLAEEGSTRRQRHAWKVAAHKWLSENGEYEYETQLRD